MNNFQFSIFNFKSLALSVFVALLCLSAVQTVHADSVIDNAVSFLKSKQDSAGRITTGFSAPSQWSAIALTAAGLDVSTIKNPTNSLKDFLSNDIPASSSAATEFETRILAIVAAGFDPTSFGGANFVAILEAKYDGTQIGDSCSLNDDIFGLLALVAASNTSTTSTKQGVLNYIISKQDGSDGGFGFSAPGCAWYSTSADMTGSAIQALQAAKDNGLTNAGLDNAITSAKNYLLANQDSDGGFGYFGSSDTDTTGWVLMAFNALGMGSSTQATNARNYLISQLSSSDGGITAFDWGSSTFVSNATTTAQALIGLLGKSWILKIYTPPVSPTSTPTATATPTAPPSPSSTPTLTSAPSSSNSSASSSPTNAPTPSPKPTATPTAAPSNSNQTLATALVDNSVIPPPSTPKQEVLGAKTGNPKVETEIKVTGATSIKPLLIKLYLLLGFASFASWLLLKYYRRAI